MESHKNAFYYGPPVCVPGKSDITGGEEILGEKRVTWISSEGWMGGGLMRLVWVTTQVIYDACEPELDAVNADLALPPCLGKLMCASVAS